MLEDVLGRQRQSDAPSLHFSRKNDTHISRHKKSQRIIIKVY